MHTAAKLLEPLTSVMIGVKETELLRNYYFVVLYTFTDCLHAQFGKICWFFFSISD